MIPNLGIIVPYRDRTDHLNIFVPHIAAFFSRAAKEVGGAIRVKIVEQEQGLEFNRGFLKNIGYNLCKGSCDYVCFHDVDHIPIWADYSAPKRVAPIVWYGAEKIIDPRRVQVTHDLAKHFGGAVLFNKQDFERINGYPNGYWGWGYEDSDIRHRCLVLNMPIERRKGTFQVLPHIHEGYDDFGNPSAINIRNRELFEQRFPSSSFNEGDAY